jgi:hypothetical protein
MTISTHNDLYKHFSEHAAQVVQYFTLDSIMNNDNSESSTQQVIEPEAEVAEVSVEYEPLQQLSTNCTSSAIGVVLSFRTQYSV